MPLQIYQDVKKRSKIIVALSLLVLFLTYQASVTAFTHVHYVNGVLITHSHPYHGSHSHTKSAILVIDRLAAFCSPEVEVYESLHPMSVLLAVVKTEPVHSAGKTGVERALSLRAPPAPAA